MDWLNLHASLMNSPEFVGSDTRERGVWLSLLNYCIGQENGGRVSECKDWKDRQWQQLARVTAREVSRDCRLFFWDGETLCVWGYPLDKESEVVRKRETARANGKTGGRPKVGLKHETQTITNGQTHEKPTLVISPKAEREWKGKGNGMESIQPPPSGDGLDGGSLKGFMNGHESEPTAPPQTDTPPKPRPRDPLFDTLARIEGSDPLQLTKPAARAIGVALAAIRSACPSLTPDEIQRRAKNYPSVMPPGSKLTAHALCNHWAKCDKQADTAEKARYNLL